MRVEVLRDPADKDGGVIYEPLINTLSGLVARGRLEIEGGEKQTLVQINTPFMPDARTGAVVEVADELGLRWRGKISGIKHTHELGMTSTTLEVVRRER
jgi:hypothetical protein